MMFLRGSDLAIAISITYQYAYDWLTGCRLNTSDWLMSSFLACDWLTIATIKSQPLYLP